MVNKFLFTHRNPKELSAIFSEVKVAIDPYLKNADTCKFLKAALLLQDDSILFLHYIKCTGEKENNLEMLLGFHLKTIGNEQ
ncbi:MAG: hypothetical protein ABEK17_04390 [Candidatus Aenigmatarchaeota archaeon]